MFFGSARVDSREGAERALNMLRARGVHNADEQYDIEMKKSRKAVEWARYYEDARELARLLSVWTLSLQSENHRFVVTSGGGPGIMEAANRGAREGGGKTIGLNIRLPFEQGANPYITDGLHFEFHYFFMRKFWFAYMAKALVVFPGGFGTLDEMFEILTLVQTDKLSKKIGVVLYGREYWEEVLDLKPMSEWGAIAEKDLELLHYADTPADAFHHCAITSSRTIWSRQPRRKPRRQGSPRREDRADGQDRQEGQDRRDGRDGRDGRIGRIGRIGRTGRTGRIGG